MTLKDRIAELNTRLSLCGIHTRADEPLSRHTSFHIGGAAALGIFPRCESEVMTALSLVEEACVPLYVIGGGSNLLAPDTGYAGAILFTGEMNRITLTDMGDGDVLLLAEAGASLSSLAKAASEAGLTGVEFLYGIPGTVGGAVVMNAGAYGGETGNILVSSRFVKRTAPTAVCDRPLAEHAYGYRQSVYLSHPEEIVLSAVFRLRKGDRTAVEAEMHRLITQRKEKQPLEYPSAGSFFKRPVGAFAGKLIEDCGLKGYRIGGAEVSVKHAGFLVNRGNATEADVRALAAHVRETVLRETGYLLESEVRAMEGEAP